MHWFCIVVISFGLDCCDGCSRAVCVIAALIVRGLAETVAEPSLQATQLKLKRARLADDLNEKIAQRPGPMELVEKNILPVDSSLKEAIIGDYIHEIGINQLC